jgi:hypothetical protein
MAVSSAGLSPKSDCSGKAQKQLYSKLQTRPEKNIFLVFNCVHYFIGSKTGFSEGFVIQKEDIVQEDFKKTELWKEIDSGFVVR